MAMTASPLPLLVGVDLIEMPRFEATLARYGPRLLERVFTPVEIHRYGEHAMELAARFAAKEAVSKALGVGMRMLAHDGIRWQDVEVVGDSRGKPMVHLFGRAAERAQELGVTEWAISLSHTRQNAIAMVIAY